MKSWSLVVPAFRLLSFAGLVALGASACDDDTGAPRGPVGPPTPPRAGVGEPCVETVQCGEGPAPVCIQPDFEWLNGYCSSSCGSHDECGAGAGCVAFDDGSARCLELCSFDSDCRGGYSCFDLDGPGYCIPSAMADRAGYATQCADLGYRGECLNNNVYWCDDAGEIRHMTCEGGCAWDHTEGWICQ